MERAREEQGGTLLVPLPGLVDTVEEARRAEALGEAEIRDALAQGRTMDLQAAVDLAVRLLEVREATRRRPGSEPERRL